MQKTQTRTFISPLYLILCLGLFLASSLSSAATLGEVRALADSGLSGLALRMLDKNQPLAEQDAAPWSEWEQLRYEILEREGNHQALVNRYEIVSSNVSPAFHVWSAGKAAQAWINLKNGYNARRILREVIWEPRPDSTAPPGAQLAEWSELIVRSYLVDDLARDAQLSAQKFIDAYGKQNPRADDLYVRALILADKQTEAAAYLSGANRSVTQSISLLVDLQSGKKDAKKILAIAKRASEKQRINSHDRLELLLVAADAAYRSEQYSSQLALLEKALILQAQTTLLDKVFVINADKLWQAYHQYAEYTGNKSKLLVGEDAKWYAEAVSLSGRHKVRAKAMFAFLANKGGTPEIRTASHEQFAKLTAGIKGRYILLNQLYLHSPWYPSESDVPAPVRAVLAEEAIANSDIAFASRMLDGGGDGKAKQKDVDTSLRHARIHIMAGQYQKGVELLEEIVPLSDVTNKKEADKLIQVIFDLQNAGQHKQTFELFGKLLERLTDIQHKREILFWMADSQKESGNHTEAAWLYLRSALLDNPKARDPWADSARYHAANALAKAGLKDDARKIYQDMLKYTKDLGRRKVLQREMQQVLIK